MRVKVTAKRLNVRTGPGVNYDVVDTLLQGETVDIVDTTDWLPIKLTDESIAWVNRKFVEQVSEDEDVDVIRDIINECDKQGLKLLTQKAYVLATVEWETAGTFKPIREAPHKSELWRKQNLRYWPYYGRGYVQLTWRENYERYGKILKIDLVNNPDLALDHQVALFILAHGFKHGTFTGKKLEDYVNENKTDFVNARRVINVLDKADTIAGLAHKWLRELRGDSGKQK